MLTNLFIPGAAHLRVAVRHLNDQGVLNCFYYAHARRTTPASLGLPDDRGCNLWLKEYLIRGHLRLFGWRFTDALFPLYHKVWEHQLLEAWKPAPIAHGVLWGASRRVFERAGRDGTVRLGMAVNAHPQRLIDLLAEEGDRLGIPQRARWNRLQRSIVQEIEHCDHIHAESQFTKASFIAQGFPADRVHVVSPGQDLTRFFPATAQQENERPAGFHAISVGQISLRKGQIHLLRAWRKLGLANASLTLVGHVHGEIAHLIDPYRDMFEHMPSVPNTALRDLLVQKSVMVVPSIEDGYALVVAEALACGIPVITTAQTGASSLIQDGVNGYVLPAADADAIAEKLALLEGNPELLSALRQGARQSTAAIGSWERQAALFAQLYKELAR